MDREFTLAELTSITGAKRRTVQLWAEAGAIQADAATERAGTGVYRRFSRSEALVACMLASLSYLKMSIGELVQRGADLRKWIETADRTEIDDCISGKREMIVFFWRCEEYPEHPMLVFINRPGDPLDSSINFFGTQVMRAANEPQALLVCIPLGSRLRALA
ncbi:hypothetical protein [Mesorhizobium sp.]|uniref:hypothetical protein n=1 Tax=Mesorhizobium sp. TaxID=1871066 RepID=UPI000FE6CC48|nr:hypothetical protein [Mesorhizobium sp.]RWC41975.1 MAG: hypothetical protein EOS28_18465 [Mesorhizobium sp.]RWE96327.1 MAG: hypothetical protein EOS68_17825 [Mesorhizobium sp.]